MYASSGRYGPLPFSGMSGWMLIVSRIGSTCAGVSTVNRTLIRHRPNRSERVGCININENESRNMIPDSQSVLGVELAEVVMRMSIRSIAPHTEITYAHLLLLSRSICLYVLFMFRRSEVGGVPLCGASNYRRCVAVAAEERTRSDGAQTAHFVMLIGRMRSRHHHSRRVRSEPGNAGITLQQMILHFKLASDVYNNIARTRRSRKTACSCSWMLNVEFGLTILFISRATGEKLSVSQREVLSACLPRCSELMAAIRKRESVIWKVVVYEVRKAWNRRGRAARRRLDRRVIFTLRLARAPSMIY